MLAERRLAPVICVVLALLTLAVFWQVTGHGFVNYDDDDYVAANLHVKNGLSAPGIAWAFTTFHEANWHPLTWVSHMIDCSLFGLKPGGHHAVNLLLHIFSAILLFLVLRRMMGCTWQSAFVAALFAVHPLHVESVAWIAERKDALSTLFWMLTILAYVWYTERPSTERYLPVAVAFALGLMCKPMLVTLPFVLLLLDWWPLGRLSAEKGWTARRLVIEKLPLIGLAVVSGAITFAAQHRGLAVGSIEQYPLGVRIANAVVAYVAYLVKMVLPTKLAVFYPHPGSSLPTWQVIGSAVLLAAITVLVVRARQTRPCLAVGWFWYLVTLLPVIGLVQVGMQSMADRYTYVPMVGVFIALAWAVGQVGRARLVGVLAVLIVIGCAVGAWRQVGYWHDSKTLFSHALAVTKNNAVAENNLGLALAAEYKLDQAIKHHRCAVEINPGWADARYSLGVVLHERGQTAEAVAEFEKALAIDQHHAQAHNSLGIALVETGHLPEAITHLKHAVSVRPDYAQAWNNLGTALSFQGKHDESVTLFAKAARIDPNLADAHYNLALGLAQQNRGREAIEECRKALALKPGWIDAENNLAWFLATVPTATSRDTQEAVKLAEKVCRATRNSNPQYLDTLAAAYESAGRREDALRTARKALALEKHRPTTNWGNE